jgi:undecaprenyl-diphosphatase
MLEHINQTLFLMINAPAHPTGWVVLLAWFCASGLIWLAPMIMVAGWLRGSDAIRMRMLETALAGLTGLLISQLIGFYWPHPRPFMIGLGHTLISHAADASFPSDHLTLMWSTAFCLLARGATRTAGAWLALLGVPLAWARIYLGVHFPFDMLGALLVSLLSAWLCQKYGPWLLAPVFVRLLKLYRRMFAPCIRKRWILY